jgi:hypothetical protein
MTIFICETEITYGYLLGKKKSDLADMIFLLLDQLEAERKQNDTRD